MTLNHKKETQAPQTLIPTVVASAILFISISAPLVASLLAERM